MKKLLIIIDQRPQQLEGIGSLKLQETIDAALGIASFGGFVSIWFTKEGVNCLQKSTNLKIVEALQYYDIENVYVTKEDLERYKPKMDTLELDIIQINQTTISSLLIQYDNILRMN